MSNNIIKMNKKGQQYYPRPSYNSVHPVLIAGIFVFVIPFLLPVIGIHAAPSWLKTGLNFLGVLLILVGGALSIFKASN